MKFVVVDDDDDYYALGTLDVLKACDACADMS